MTTRLTLSDEEIERLTALDRAHFFHAATPLQQHAKDGPRIFVGGEGIYLYDAKGRPFIDVLASLWNVNCGHGRQDIVDAITGQMRQLVYDRFLVRQEELRQSVRILDQALKRLPDGPVNVDDPRVILPPKSKATSEMESMIHHFKLVMEGPRPPIGEAYVAIESPKGEKGYYMVSGGTSKPVRWKSWKKSP